MPKLYLRELEEARKNPAAFRRKLEAGSAQGYGRSFFLSLRDTVFNFHKWDEDTEEALSYLERRLDDFSNAARRDETIDQFLWYIGEYIQRGWSTFETRLNIQIRLSDSAPRDLQCTGQVSRIDMVPTGGYVAWLFRSRDPQGWEDELQMPLVQDTLSRVILSCPLSEVGVGIYSFKERYVDYRRYSAIAVEQAQTNLKSLLERMGY